MQYLCRPYSAMSMYTNIRPDAQDNSSPVIEEFNTQAARSIAQNKQGIKRPFADDKTHTQAAKTHLRSHTRLKSPDRHTSQREREHARPKSETQLDRELSRQTKHEDHQSNSDQHALSNTHASADNEDDLIFRVKHGDEANDYFATTKQARSDGVLKREEDEISVGERRRRREIIRAKYNPEKGILTVPVAPSTPPEIEMLPPLPANSAVHEQEAAVADDMFASDNEDDMFEGQSGNKRTDHILLEQGHEMEKGLSDNWDDPKGYYRFSKNEVLDGRYQLLDSHGLGKGMFSNVVRANDVNTSSLVAIKIIRNNESMRKAAVKEMDILQKLALKDPSDKKHLVRLRRSFTHKRHLCMVFENLSQDLRELLKKFGRDTGFDMSAIRAYARQLFLGLDLLKQCNIIHADLKPDNILASEAPHAVIKICDLGSAFDATEAADTPELASRFYRAPEVMLGIPYDFAIDMWSVGCTLYELYTGRILFTGGTNNQMLHSIMKCRGMLSERYAEKGTHCHEHFEFRPFLSFRSIEADPSTGLERARLIQSFQKSGCDLKQLLLAASPHLKRSSDKKPTYNEKVQVDRQSKELTLFADLLDKCLKTNPDQRIQPQDALQHPFFGDPKADPSRFQPPLKRPGLSK